LAAYVEEHRIGVVLPVSEASMLALLARRETVSAVIPFADEAVFRSICDKPSVLEAAARLGIRVPRQRCIASPSDTADVLDALPTVLKPHASVVTDSSGTRIQVGVRWAHTATELRQALAAYPETAFPIMAQEVIHGPGIGIFLLMREGEPLAQFSHRRIREKPPSGGVSVVCQSEPMNTDLLERSIRLLRHFDWNGPAMVEYKVDAATGEPVLMEINGRFWGSLQLAVDAGVDFPRLLLESHRAVPLPSPSDYRSVSMRWFWGDVDHLIARWREPGLGVWGKVQALGRWFNGFAPRYRSEVFRWGDPIPFVRESVGWVTHMMGRAE